MGRRMNAPINMDNNSIQYKTGYVKGYRNGFVDGIAAAEQRKMQMEKDVKKFMGPCLEL